jgi:hypothetical protein
LLVDPPEVVEFDPGMPAPVPPREPPLAAVCRNKNGDETLFASWYRYCELGRKVA